MQAVAIDNGRDQVKEYATQLAGWNAGRMDRGVAGEAQRLIAVLIGERGVGRIVGRGPVEHQLTEREPSMKNTIKLATCQTSILTTTICTCLQVTKKKPATICAGRSVSGRVEKKIARGDRRGD